MLVLMALLCIVCGYQLVRCGRLKAAAVISCLLLVVQMLNLTVEYFDELRSAAIFVMGKDSYHEFAVAVHKFLHTESFSMLLSSVATLCSLISLFVTIVVTVLFMVMHTVVGEEKTERDEKCEPRYVVRRVKAPFGVGDKLYLKYRVLLN